MQSAVRVFLERIACQLGSFAWALPRGSAWARLWSFWSSAAIASVGGLGFLLRPKLLLQSHQEVAQDLILAFPVLGLGGVAEKGAEFVRTDPKAPQGENGQHVVVFVIQRDAEFAEDLVVVEGFFGDRDLIVFFASIQDDEPVEEGREVFVVEFFELGIVFFFEPKGDFFEEYVHSAQGKNLGHLVVMKVEGIA